MARVATIAGTTLLACAGASRSNSPDVSQPTEPNAQTRLGAPAAQPEGRRVAVTFDDLPGTAVVGGDCDADAWRRLTGRLADTIRAHGVPVVGLVTEGRVCDSLRATLLPELLDAWLDAGAELGNHTFSHGDLNRVVVERFTDDIVAGERISRARAETRGSRYRYFRYPYLHTGETAETKRAVEHFLHERGYVNAPVTIDNQEWIFAAAYAHAKARGDEATMKRVAEAYVPFMQEVFGFFETWSVEVLGYEPPQVLLLHANELNADHFGSLVEMMERRGYAFVTLEQALADEAYHLPDEYVGRRGLSWIHRWAVSLGMTPREEPREPTWLRELFDRQRAGDAGD